MAAVTLVSLACAPVARVAADELDGITDQLAKLEQEIEHNASLPIPRSQARTNTYIEERLTDGELYYRMQDYVRASIIFTDLVEHFPSHAAFPDALFFLGDSLFKAGDYLGARSRFRELIVAAEEPGFWPYVQKALGRLIEIAIRTHDFDGVDSYFAHLSRLPIAEVEDATHYFRAKYLYNMAVPSAGLVAGDGREALRGRAQQEPIDQQGLEQARLAFESVAPESPLFAQARYFIGVIHTLRAQYAQALRVFHEVANGPIEAPGQRQVVELAHMALGRLYYETNQLDSAVAAYQSVSHTSPLFDVALYEIAWTFIRQGDAIRAERALEVLSVAAPESRFIPDGQLLRANLLMREGRYADSNEVFDKIAEQFEPVRHDLDLLAAKHDDSSAYFKQLVRENMEVFDIHAFMPESALRWTDVEGEMERALDVLSDLAQARQLVRETGQLVQRIDGALSAPNVVTVFTDLRSQKERVVGLRNQLMQVRRSLIDIEGKNLPNDAHEELAAIRARRRELEHLLSDVPLYEMDFERRSGPVLGRYRGFAQQLSELDVHLMGIEARVVATDRFMNDTADQQRDPEGLVALNQELANQQRAVREHRRSVEELRLLVEAGRLQVGVGDVIYAHEDALRQEYEQLVSRERTLVAAANRSLTRIDDLVRRVDAANQRLQTRADVLGSVVEDRRAAMSTIVREERDKLETYRAQLADLEEETEQIVGAVTHASFSRVRRRFYDLVLRAEIGKVDVAWSERENHRMRGEALTRERVRDLRTLDDEFREVMDEGATQGGGK